MTLETESVRLPSRVLPLLADGCGEAGSTPAAALREAGRLTGDRLLEELAQAADPEQAAPGSFWARASRALADRGLGSLEVRVPASDLADVTLSDGPESAHGERRRPGCPFSTGLLGGLLSGAAGEPMAVLEVECAADGAGACRFLAGSEARVSRVGDRLREGASVDEAVRAP